MLIADSHYISSSFGRYRFQIREISDKRERFSGGKEGGYTENTGGYFSLKNVKNIPLQLFNRIFLPLLNSANFVKLGWDGAVTRGCNAELTLPYLPFPMIGTGLRLK